ncbi:hypothetical protein [Salinibacter ruber]|uniref:Terminase large subunit gp17-like C-terminal domain-containing protein n=1 Tax=Salinibacter ruber TaxID=146919 RepID=A0A9X2TLN8_9BACT|nr:hypothetical protein [Salinibacter ruber]MCS3662314.1 hypothetical protein [Salinibacter ruber]MCS3712108.1 hypothetical protein [Salinibacter ruber]
MNDPNRIDTSQFLGLDLGQSSDPSALTVAEQQVPIQEEHPSAENPTGETRGEPAYLVRHIERFDLGTPYPDVVRRVASVLGAPETGDDPTLIMDASGVGAPVVDQFHEEGLRPVEITFTGGNDVQRDGRRYSVPKSDLVGTVQTLLQSRRLQVVEELDLASALATEMKRFRVKTTTTGHVRFEHATESDTDDILLSLACALWYAERPTAGFVIA